RRFDLGSGDDFGLRGGFRLLLLLAFAFLFFFCSHHPPPFFGAVSSSPLLARRIFCPLSPLPTLTRVPLPVFGSIGITLLAKIGASFSRMPPCRVFRVGSMWRLMRFPCSTTTRPSSVKRRTLPFLPLSLPLMTTTSSPMRSRARPITAPPARAR